MNSLRPLATIALLAAVGVFLYMKINDSEPKLSPELEEWSNSTLEVGGGVETLDLGPSTGADPLAEAPAAAPPFASTAPAGGDAPAFSSATLNPPAPKPAAASEDAPAWSPGPAAGAVAAAPPAAAASNASVESSSAARSANDLPPLPDMPPLPGAGAATAAVAASTPAAAPPASASQPAAPPAASITPTPTATPSMFARARVAVQGALDRGELATALATLSEWYGDPSLTPAETAEVNELLSQLAGSVIYEGPPAHRLLPAHLVKAGETLESIADQYQVPWQLLAKVNGIADPNALTPGQELKVMPGPFSAVIDLSERKLTLMLDRRYAGQFPLELDPAVSVELGQWKVDQKQLTPAAGGIYAPPGSPSEDRSLLLANEQNPMGQAAILRGPGAADPVSAEPRGRVLRMKAPDVGDVYDILSIGSRVTIQR